MALIEQSSRVCALNRPDIGRTTSCEIDLYDTIDEVPAAWDHLAESDSLFLSRAYLQLLEVHGPPNQLPRYALIKKNGLPIVAVKAVIFDVDDDMLSVRDRTAFNSRQRPLGHFLDKSMTWIRNRSLGVFGRRIVLCGNLFSCGQHGVACRQNEDLEDLWPAVIETLQKIQQADGKAAYFVVKDIIGQNADYHCPLANYGFAHLRVEPSMDLHIPESWHTYSDYLDNLNTKYRKSAKIVHDAVKDFGATIETGVDPCPIQDELHRLYVQVERHAQIRFGTLQRGYLSALAQMAGPERFRCTTIRKGNAIIGFSAVLKDGDPAVAHIVGFDYWENARTPIYLQILHQIIEDGLALNCRVIHYGRTALEPKARLGATPTDTEIWVKHGQPMVNYTVSGLLRLVSEDKAPHREPFRLEGSSVSRQEP
jgi:hypothetical protein